MSRFGVAVCGLILLATGRAASLPPVETVVANMLAHDAARQAALHGYSGTRRYHLANGALQKQAEMLVHISCGEDGSKKFEVVSESGWGAARKHVFPRLLEVEAEAAEPEIRERSRITPGNYLFTMLGTESLRGRQVYVLGIEPRTVNKFLTRGRIWVDADEYAIVRIEGSPAKKPSFWIKNVHFVHEYTKNGLLWVPASDRSVTEVRMLGGTEMVIEYFDYRFNSARALTTEQSMLVSHP